ncbi:unnamed protein product [Paramecium sonneborni]|uniref:Uncharacterized protein n=1 Tax=Paramecium sonneborni TaxID=65129 RepID=A0A8S1QVS3_9CILI|nr:unnamed protein product [Paramecium sonneborni]
MYITDFKDIESKRVKERLVESAYSKVQIWRKIFLEGLINEQGEKQYYTLNEASNFVGIPKKTLEDYTQIFHKVELIASVYDFQGKKMGFLRQFIRKNKSKIRKALFAERLRQYQKKQENLNKKCIEDSSNKLDELSSFNDKESTSYKISDTHLFDLQSEEQNFYQESRVFLPYQKF